MVLIHANCIAQYLKNPIVAHRGAWKEFGLPENSIAALQQAILLGCGGTEFDVHLTKDAVLVVNHDHHFYGLSIEKSSYAELLIKSHPNSEHIPTLKAYLEEGLKQKNTRLVMEIKSSQVSISRTYMMIDLIKDLVEGNNYEGQLEFILFDFDAAIYIKQQLPSFIVSYLNGDRSPQDIKSSGLNGIDYNYAVLLENLEYFKACREDGLFTNAWTVNDPIVFEKFVNHKINAITTDYPSAFMDYLENK